MLALLNALWFTVLIVWLIALVFNRDRCKCGRTKPFYFAAESHRRARWQYMFAVYVTGRLLWMIVQIDWWAVIEALLWLWVVRWLWFHETGKIKRAQRALGRVFVNENGRLAVTNDR